MAITSAAEQIKRLRSYLNPYIKGKNTDAVIAALASGNAAYLVNNIRAVNDSLYIATATGQYLDARLAEAGIIRPPEVGISDDIFRQIGIEVKNRKQVRDLINNLLDYIFGDEYVRASNPARTVEPYNLQDGDTLIFNFDEKNTTTVTFHAAQFQDIAAATAQEVADAIVIELRNIGLGGTAIAKNDGNGGYVELLSDTIGPASSVTVLGGSAQNIFLFDTVVPAGGNASTQWTVSIQQGGIIRFTWTGGANPNTGKLTVGNYVNIYRGGFTAYPTIEGTYTITTFLGGIAGVGYFEVYNPTGLNPGSPVTQGSDTAVLFYNPTKKTLGSRQSYAAVYQVQSRMLQIFLPASTKVVRRSRVGSAHIHCPPEGTFQFFAQPSNGDIFSITSTIDLVVGTDFLLGADYFETIRNLVAKVKTYPGLFAIANTITDDYDTATIYNNSLSNTLTITYTGAANIVATEPDDDNTSLEPNQPGPYAFDLAQSFVVSSIGTLLNQELDGSLPRVVEVLDSSQFPDEEGFFILGYGTDRQEVVPYIARPSNTTLLINPAYTIKFVHPIGEDLSFIAQKSPVVVDPTGLDYAFYSTSTTVGRIYAQDLINSVASVGISIVYTILYPSDIGLGEWGTQYSENPTIWGQ